MLLLKWDCTYTYKGTNEIKSAIKCIALSSTLMIINCQLEQWYAKTNQNTFLHKETLGKDHSNE